MKAVICTKYGAPEVLQLTEIEKPSPKVLGLLSRKNRFTKGKFMNLSSIIAEGWVFRGDFLNLRL